MSQTLHGVHNWILVVFGSFFPIKLFLLAIFEKNHSIGDIREVIWEEPFIKYHFINTFSWICKFNMRFELVEFVFKTSHVWLVSLHFWFLNSRALVLDYDVILVYVLFSKFWFNLNHVFDSYSFHLINWFMVWFIQVIWSSYMFCNLKL